jgi:hypothetical protein
MKNQFFYTRIENDKSYKDSFNVNRILRSVVMEDGRTLVLLDDIHERSQDVPDVNPKTNIIKGYKRQRDTFQSEIYLSPEDSERFQTLTSV